MSRRRNNQLVSRNAIDGLLHGVSDDKRSAANAIAILCGYDPAQPHPFYRVDVAVCLAQRLSEMLHPQLSEADAQRELGYACSKGYATTITGMISLSKSLGLSVSDALRYGLEVTSREMPSLEYRIEPLGEHHYLVELTNFPLHPNFMVGALLYNLEVNGAQQPSCTMRVLNELHYSYEFHWDSNKLEGVIFIKGKT